MQPSQRDQNSITIQNPPPNTKFKIQPNCVTSTSAAFSNIPLSITLTSPFPISGRRSTILVASQSYISPSPIITKCATTYFLLLCCSSSHVSVFEVLNRILSAKGQHCVHWSAQYHVLKMINSTLVGQTLPFFFTGTALAYFHLGNIKGRQFMEGPEWGRPHQGQVNDQMGDVTETRKVYKPRSSHGWLAFEQCLL
jgi:hypothetical protein